MIKWKTCDIEKQIDLLKALARHELVEFMVPLAFLFLFVIAYYGPNCGLFFNICAAIWQYVAIEDINVTIKIVLLLFIFSILAAQK